MPLKRFNIHLTPGNSKPRKLAARANSNQNWFPLDLLHTFTVILPSITWTLDNSNLPLTRSEFQFPSGYFPYNLTLDNSNFVCQRIMRQNILHNTEFILNQFSKNRAEHCSFEVFNCPLCQFLQFPGVLAHKTCQFFLRESCNKWCQQESYPPITRTFFDLP